jgi:predicted nucleotidyltransferase
MNIKEILDLKPKLYEIAAKYGIKKVYVFGSVARGESDQSSDIDLLIDMEEGASAFGIGGFQHEAQMLLGVRIDVIPSYVLPKVKDRYFVESIQSEAIAI